MRCTTGRRSNRIRQIKRNQELVRKAFDPITTIAKAAKPFSERDAA
jgi:hypothetical protein